MTAFLGLLFALAPQALPPCPQTRRIDTLVNGDFQMLSACGDLGLTRACGAQPYAAGDADGGFWVGAEGLTTLGTGSNRFLQFGSVTASPGPLQRFVYQRLAAASDMTQTTELEVRARVNEAMTPDEARITLAESDGDQWQLGWFLFHNQLIHNYQNYQWTCGGSTLCNGTAAPCPNPDSPEAMWSLYEDRNGVQVPMCWRYTNQGVPGWENYLEFFSNTGGPCPDRCQPAPAGVNTVGSGVYLDSLTPTTTKVVAAWKAPKQGCVRVGTRLWRPGSGADCRFEVFLQRGTSNPVPIRCLDIVPNDENGAVVLDRQEVLPNDLILFALSKTTPGSASGSVQWDPTVVYEGRRYTYRITCGSCAPPATAVPECNETIYPTVLATTGTGWKTFALSAGSDWMTAYGTPPRTPLEVQLSAPPTNVGAVDFDNVRGYVRYCDVSSDDLLARIYQDVAFARDNDRYRRDRGTDAAQPTPNNNQKGSIATPFTVWRLDAYSGQHLTQLPPSAQNIANSPYGVWDRLSLRYDQTDYDDYFWIHEQMFYNRHPLTGLLYGTYDCETDKFRKAPGETTGTGMASALVNAYYRTKDVSCLDVAARYVHYAVLNGIVSNNCSVAPWWKKVVLEGGYKVSDGSNVQPCLPEPAFLYAMDSSAIPDILRTYVAIKRYPIDHPEESPDRFQAYDLDQWIQAANDAIDKIVAEIGVSLPTWASGWHDLPGHFNDDFGYLAGGARSYQALETLPAPLTAAEIHARDQLKNGIVLDGVRDLLPLWEQALSRGEVMNSDQGRAWPNFHALATETPPCNPGALTAADQLVRAAYYWLKFQYPGGAWTNPDGDSLQILKYSASAGQPTVTPNYYTEGFLLAMDVANASQREDLVDILYTVLRTTKHEFRDRYTGLTYGFAKHPWGYPLYNPPGGPLGPPYTPATILSDMEKRNVDRMLEGLSFTGFDALGLQWSAPPVATIAPPSLSTVQYNPVFTFTIDVGASGLDPLTALNTRAQVDLWHEEAGQWLRKRMWPVDLSHTWIVFGTPTASGTTASVTATWVGPTYNPFIQTFKLDLHTWDPNGQWDRDTSFLQW